MQEELQSLAEADVAQLVEQLIRNQQVSGSSPLAGSNLALIKRTASDPVLMVALSDPTVCANAIPDEVQGNLFSRRSQSRLHTQLRAEFQAVPSLSQNGD